MGSESMSKHERGETAATGPGVRTGGPGCVSGTFFCGCSISRGNNYCLFVRDRGREREGKEEEGREGQRLSDIWLCG